MLNVFCLEHSQLLISTCIRMYRWSETVHTSSASDVAWVIGARDRLQFCRPKKSRDAWCPLVHPQFLPPPRDCCPGQSALCAPSIATHWTRRAIGRLRKLLKMQQRAAGGRDGRHLKSMMSYASMCGYLLATERTSSRIEERGNPIKNTDNWTGNSK